MKELQDILVRYAEIRRQGGVAVLATVFRVSGSTYRRPGARMLVTEGGLSLGCVSGGCLERHVVEQARRALAAGAARTLVYDSLSDGLLDEGFGQGCNGAVHVLVEPLPPSGVDHLKFLSDCLRLRENAVVATIVEIHGRPNAKLAERATVSGGKTISSIADPSLQSAVAADANRMTDKRSTILDYDVRGGRVAVFFERIESPLSLVVFGAGHDATPLVRMAQGLGWRVDLVDHRPSHIARSRSLVPSDCVAIRAQDVAGDDRLTARTAVVVMNHNYLDDLEALRVAIQSNVRYIGVLGPRERTINLIDDLRAQGEAVTNAQLERVYGPVGLDIGADDPDQIALAIVAEIHAVFAGAEGGSLRDRIGPLHHRESPSLDGTPSSPIIVENRCALG